MKYLKFLSVLLLLCVVITACSAEKGKNNPSDVSSVGNSAALGSGTGSVNLLYCASDRIDPFSAVTTINKQLATLIFEPLVTVNRNFEAENVLAESITLTGKTCIVTLKQVNFTDGSQLTADDVVYSIKQAVKQQQIYSDMFANVKSYSVSDIRTVSIVLNHVDPYFANCLEIPIIKAESDTKTDQDNIALVAVGTGRYVFDYDNKKLVANTSFHGGTVMIPEIGLINAPDAEVIDYNLRAGNVATYYTDLQDCIVPQTNGSIKTTDLNNLVYLGVNMSSPNLNNVDMRYAISSAINRDDLCESGFHSYASPAKGIYNTVFADGSSIQVISPEPNITDTADILSKLGYTGKNNEGFYFDSNGKSLTFRMIYCSDNIFKSSAAKLITKYMEAAGIKIDAVPLEWDAYKAALEANDFDLYIGEVKIPLNMDISQLVIQGGTAAYGVINPVKDHNNGSDSSENVTSEPETETNSEFTLAEMIQKFYNDEVTITDVVNSFNSELPVIPLCYRKGVAITSNILADSVFATVNQPFYGFETNRIK